MKNKINFLAAVLISTLFITSCGNPSGGGDGGGQTPVVYNLGDTGPGGGKIFYASEEGFTVEGHASFGSSYTAHYLEAGLVDLVREGESDWDYWATSENQYINIPGTEMEIGTGRKNTGIIISILDEKAPAATLCANYRLGGKTDWFLPSSDELVQLYNNKTYVGNFSLTFYWSSSQMANSAENAWRHAFDNGNAGTVSKFNRCYIRAIRAF